MFLSTHAVVGVYLSTQTGHPLWAFLTALGSHFILDAIPHGDQGLGEWVLKDRRVDRLFWLVSTDLTLLTLFIVYLYTQVDLPGASLVSAGVVGAILPDAFSTIHHGTEHYFLSPLPTFFRRLLKLAQVHRFLTTHHRLHQFIHFRILKLEINFLPGLFLQGVVTAVFLAITVITLEGLAK